MKKMFAVLLCAILVSSCAAISAAAYDSPTYNPGESDTDPNGGGEGDSDKSRPSSDSDTSAASSKADTDNGSKTSSTTSTSPKTGAPVSFGVLMAAAALAFGGVAVSTKKKIEE